MRANRLWVTFGVGMLLTACNSTGPADPGDAPELPLEEALAFDIETFPPVSSSVTAPGAPARVPSGTHHTVAALTVLGINVAVVTVTAVPRLTWAALATRQPTFEDGRWHWRGSTSILGVTYSGDLSAFTEQGDVVAEVRISSPVVSNFLWYDLHAPIGGTSGQWRVYDANQPSTPTVVGTIDWTHPAADEWNLTFTTVGGANAGDNLMYAVDGDDRTVSWYDASAATTHGIGWDAVTHAGYIQAAAYNGGVRSCWDTNLQNVTCP